MLPDYDGVTWRVGAVYRNAGRVLPRQPAQPDVALTTVRERITIDGLSGRLLPALPVPTGVEGARVAFDAGPGTLIRPEGLTAGLTYTVTSDVPAPDLNLLPTAEAPSGEAVARYLAVGAGVPEPIQRLADQLAEGNGGAFDRASAIEEFLSEHYQKVPDAPSGHAYPNLQFFLFGPRDQGGQRGTSEQFAASFALLARLTGLPSRVVVGFDVPASGTVTAADAIAWPEVLFTDLGWVPFDPMPKSDDPRPVEADFTPQPPTPPPTTTEAPPPSDETSASVPPSVSVAAPGSGPPVALVAGGVSGATVLILVAAGLALVLSRRALRRHRLTRGDPGERITGAWYEFTDALRLAGRPVPAHLTATEAAAFAVTARAQAERSVAASARAADEARAGDDVPAARRRPGGLAVAAASGGPAERGWWHAGATAAARRSGGRREHCGVRAGRRGRRSGTARGRASRRVRGRAPRPPILVAAHVVAAEPGPAAVAPPIARSRRSQSCGWRKTGQKSA